jgi:hypothetical protein
MRLPLAGMIAVTVALGGEALAGPLDAETCKGVKAEREALTAHGLEADIAKGPEWGRANLAPERLKEIARYIELTEQLTFRCGELAVVRPDGKPLLKRPDPPSAAAAAAGAAPVAADGTAKPAKKKKKAPPASDAAAAPAAKQP